MLPEQDIVRVCALVVATATGIDPLAHIDSPRAGKSDLQYARALWINLIVAECGIDRGRASYLCNRSLESIAINLAEVEEWRSDSAFDEAMARWAESAKRLVGFVFDVTVLRPPIPSKDTRIATRAIVRSQYDARYKERAA